MRVTWRIAVLVVAAAWATQLTAQRGVGPAPRDQPIAATTGTSSIVGTVLVNEPNGQPVRRAMISIRSSGVVLPRQTTTDDQGRFAFTNLPAGTYSAPTATKAGYVASNYGERRPGGIGTPLTLAEGQRLSIAFKLLRGAVITGTVFDNGKPFQTSVSVSSVRMVNGVRTTGLSRGGSTQTDDRGVYRIYGLTPGDYVVAATPRSIGAGELRPITDAEIQWAQRQLQAGAAMAPGNAPASTVPPPAQPIGYTPVYYPGTTSVTGATTVTVAAGQEKSGVDFSVSYVATAKIEGVLLDPSGQPAQNAQMNLIPMTDSSEVLLSETSFVMETMLFSRPTVVAGKFSMANVRPGRYTLAARASDGPAPSSGPGRGGPPPAMTLWASTEITVNGEDRSGIELRLQPGVELSGKMVFEASTLPVPADLTRLTVRLAPAPTSTVTVSVNVPSGTVTADGTFKLEGVAPGRYLLTSFVPGATASGGPSWILKSARVGDVDAADSVFEVKPNQPIPDIVLTFSDRPGELSGTLLDATDKPTAALSIILFPTDKSMWSQFQRARRIRPPVRAGNDGKFKFTGLLPGEYFLAALGDFDQNDVYKPEFLEQVAAAAMKITISEGEKKVQDLKIAGGG